MKLDLYKLYKKFYQRSYRNPCDQDLQEMTRLIRTLTHNLYRSNFKENTTDEDIRIAVSVAKNLLDLERSYGGLYAYFSLHLAEAIESGKYEINVPKHKMASWLEDNDHLGTLYVLTSKSRPEQCKLGVTQGNLEERIRKYEYRHGYSVDLYFYRADIPTPFKHEVAITQKYLEHKNTNNFEGDSNEWFFLFPETLKKEILDI